MTAEKAIQLGIFSYEDVVHRPCWVSIEGEYNKLQAVLDKLAHQNIDISSLKIRKVNGDEWFCIYIGSYFCYCRCSYNEDSQDYSNIDKIQVEFGYETNSQIIFDSDYIVMDIIVPLNICRFAR